MIRLRFWEHSRYACLLICVISIVNKIMEASTKWSPFNLLQSLHIIKLTSIKFLINSQPCIKLISNIKCVRQWHIELSFQTLSTQWGFNGIQWGNNFQLMQWYKLVWYIQQTEIKENVESQRTHSKTITAKLRSRSFCLLRGDNYVKRRKNANPSSSGL